MFKHGVISQPNTMFLCKSNPKRTTILLLLCLSLIIQISSGYYVEILDKDPFMKMGYKLSVPISVKFNRTEEERLWNKNIALMISYNFSDTESWAIEIENDVNTTILFDYDAIKRNHVQNITLIGTIIGINNLQVFTREVEINYKRELIRNLSEPVLQISTQVRVIIASRVLNHIFVAVLTLLILFNTINMGGQLSLKIIKDVLKKPIGPGVGFACQFVLMPLISYGVGYFFFEDNKLYRLGLFVLGCSPGGTGSNFWCILLGGDLNLSITMTFISTVAALGMMPLWLFLVGPYITKGNLVIPYGQLIFTLLSLIAPVGLGMWISNKWKGAKKWMEKIIVPFTIILILFIFTGGIYMNLFIFRLMTWKIALAGFAVAFIGYCLGAGFAFIFRLKRSEIIAVSIETAFQNGGISFVLLKLSLGEPFGELASVATVGQLMTTGIPLWFALLILKIYLCYFKKESSEGEDVENSKANEDYDTLQISDVKANEITYTPSSIKN